MKSKLQSNQKGFTIIEVLIVLAIAGLILLIVFLAVPALQRNSRNTQRKNDVQNLLGAVQEYTNNNNGKAPDTQAKLDTAKANFKPGFYQAANVYYSNAAPAVPATIASTGAGSSTTVTAENIIVAVGFKCQNDATVIPVADTARTIAVVYAVETGGSPQYQCVGS